MQRKQHLNCPAALIPPGPACHLPKAKMTKTPLFLLLGIFFLSLESLAVHLYLELGLENGTTWTVVPLK